VAVFTTEAAPKRLAKAKITKIDKDRNRLTKATSERLAETEFVLQFLQIVDSIIRQQTGIPLVPVVLKS